MPQKVITLVKLKQWLIPADIDSYRILHQLKVPNVRFHEEFLPTLMLLLKKKKVEVQGLPFADVLNEFMDRFVSEWEKNPKRTIYMSKGVLKLESKDLRNVKRTFPEAETCLRRFFRRWGFDNTATFSESPTRAKLVVTFEISKTKQPIIEILKD